ncbi:SusD/RagB family nutrient-binding outer membrane lipoprotein [Gramella jeungdoensis]|uniref:SusD/RagB family nutrient-binding outer membrane lipoprotein n=1 Tax=Gramella jeungdoensis TaxID=708091 RepID=A0ABT0YWF4_9FLAO|nr:SusD/RagB family nutrient-binding outer membrane lipoprotein [Gramella jeungdoensis]MCM8567803.1 SusD/RagB family nutrient-binding outer membrane lipoprotein [Gramella jeungdoensis]
MKKYSLIAILFAAIIGFTSCENNDFGDTNKNVNGAQDPNPAALMTGAMMRYATLTGRDYLTRPALYVQYQSQTQYTDEQRYNESPASWSGYYVQTLSNLSLIKEIYSQEGELSPALVAQGSANNQIGVATIYSTVIWKRLTDTFGPVPFEAYFTDDLTPAYSTQETIYKTLIEDLKMARDMIAPEENHPTGDIIYGGDVTKWRKFANSMIMAMSIQLSEVAPGYASAEFASALNNEFGVIEEVDEEAWFDYQNTPGFENPWTALRKADYANSKTITDALMGNSTDDDLSDPDASHNPTSNTTYDSRLEIFSNDATADGLEYGRASNPDGASAVKLNETYIWREEAPLPIMTSAYTYLNRAEAAELGWTSEDAGEMLEKGIIQSYESMTFYWGMADYLSNDETVDITDDAAAYAAARLADAADAGMLQVIGEEKWVTLFPNGFDAWSEWRRTGFPALQPAPAAFNAGTIPTRLVYPNSEGGLNTENYQEAVNQLSPSTDNNTSTFWWDVN